MILRPLGSRPLVPTLAGERSFDEEVPRAFSLGRLDRESFLDGVTGDLAGGDPVFPLSKVALEAQLLDVAFDVLAYEHIGLALMFFFLRGDLFVYLFAAGKDGQH